jgi:hypothetical protein
MRNKNVILIILLILALTLTFNYQIDSLRKIIIEQNKIIGGQYQCIDNLHSEISKLTENIDVITGKMIWDLEW